MPFKDLVVLSFAVAGIQTGLGFVCDPRIPNQLTFASLEASDDPPIRVSNIVNKCQRNVVTLQNEFKVAVEMATIASENFKPENQYVQAFWPNQPDIEWAKYTTPKELRSASQFFACIAHALSGDDVDDCGDISPLTITCVQDEYCQRPGFLSVDAHTDANTRVINLCDHFFQQKDSATMQCVDGKSLQLYETKALTLVHEAAHLNVLPYGSAKDIKTKVTRNGQTTKIVAYGADNCIKLAANRFFDPPYEPSNKATNNADSFAFIAAGTYWLDRCIKAENDPNFELLPERGWQPPHLLNSKQGL